VTKDLNTFRDRFIEAAGHTTQSLGAGRVLGQTFAYLYLQPAPQSLDDLTRALGISKGSASTTVRQLEQWGALRRVWIKGDRKDYYEANEDFGRIIRNAMLDNILHKIETSDRFLRKMDAALRELEKKSLAPRDELLFVKKRLKNVKTFRKRAGYIWEHFVRHLFQKETKAGS
jgi:DNA-binding transcriptional regulator GbsR (MarR family)